MGKERRGKLGEIIWAVIRGEERRNTEPTAFRKIRGRSLPVF